MLSTLYLLFTFIHCREPSERQSGGTHFLWLLNCLRSVFSLTFPLLPTCFTIATVSFHLFSCSCFTLLLSAHPISRSQSPYFMPSLFPLSLSLISSNWNWQLWKSWHTPVTGSWLERNYKRATKRRDRKREYERTEREDFLLYLYYTLDVVLFRDGGGLPGMNAWLMWYYDRNISE